MTMSSLLQHLENNEAVLLMYLADELPADDRMEVDHMLATDPALRAELEELRLAQAAVVGGLDDLDKRELPPLSEAVVVRQVGRAMRQWKVDRLARQPSAAPHSRLRFPWWVYPSASAAAIILAILVWWGMKSEAPVDLARNGGDQQQQQDAFPNDPVLSQAVMLADSLTDSRDANGTGLRDAEDQASALRHSDDEVASILMFDPGGVSSSSAEQ
jgi:anti-sigma factor RsiW